MKRFMTYAKNNKGVTLILMALMLALLIMFASLAIDIAYMYFAKNQLQVAADAAALAGAAVIFNTADLSQIVGPPTPAFPAGRWEDSARAKAIEFAGKNTAAGQPVLLVTDNSNTLGDSNDITVGNWNRANNPPYTPGVAPVNAIEVKPKKWSGLSGSRGPVRIFLGPIFKLIGTDWTFMEASSHAIATRPPKATAALSLCDRTCTELAGGVTEATPLTIYWAPYPSEVDPGNQGTAWTVFSETSQSTPTDELIPFFCGQESDACNLTIYSSNGNNNAVMRQFRCAFLNPLYDSDRKTCADGVCDSSTDTVTRWKIIVPVFSSAGCPPGSQPSPYLVIKWAEVTIKQVYASGGGGTNKCACGAYNAPAMGGSTPNAIIVTKIECTSCDSSSFMGRKPALVK